MKKILAFALTCAMLLPLLAGMPIPVAAEGAVGTKPFVALTWSDIEEDIQAYDNANEMHTIHILEDKNGEPYFYRVGVGSDLDKIVQDMKAEMDSRPENMRYFHVHGLAKAFGYKAEAKIYLDNGVDKIKVMFEDLMKRYYDIGGQLTGMVQDLEYVGMSSYYLTLDLQSDPLLFNKIVSHPNYATEVRPLLAERGFKFYPNPSEYAPEIFGVSDNSGSEYSTSRTIWGVVMSNRLAMYLNEAFCEPVWKYFPDALISDYQTTDTDAWHKEVSSSGGKSYVGGNSMKAGNVSNYNVYGVAPNVNMRYQSGSTTDEYRTPTAFNGALYKDTPFNMMLWDTNRFKNMYNATDTHKVSVWITEYDYSTKRAGTVYNTPYYTENLLHIGMLDPQPFLVYMYRPSFSSDEAYYSRIGVISEIMAELTRVVGAADRTPIVLPTSWNNSFVISGMYAGGKNYWRITPDMSTGITKETFKVADAADPTFYINGQTVSFPGGKIIEDGTISVTGTCGYWVETTTDVVPVITNIANRYQVYAGFTEDFEGYEAGYKVTYGTALPAMAWEIKDKTQKNIVVEVDQNDPNNQVLAITSAGTVLNTKLVKNLTAADNYAKRQAWELTFTMPATVAADAEIILLKSGTDGGFKVTADKVYYSQNGEYVELTGVKLNAGAKYVAKRVLDFTGKEVQTEDGEVKEIFTGSYYIYDAEGNVVGSVENVEMKKFTLPVKKAGFECKNLGENTMYFDDFKMYAVGFAGDFEIFETKNGIQVKDMTVARSGETAYRYSWMNASDEEKTVQIVAQVFDAEGNVTSETVIKELVMQPGYDGVETGIYDAKDTAVVFAVKTVAEEVKESSPWLYVGIGAAAVLVLAAAAAVVIVVAKKKKK